MHQNLKFNLSLKKTKKWQPVMATEYIGTFYMVYMQINDIITDPDSNSMTLKSEFYLQNYRGAIKMGLDFKQDEEKKNQPITIYTEPKSPENDGYDYEISLPVAPFHSCDQSKEIAIVFDNGFKANKTIFEIDVKYTELPQDIFNKSDLHDSRFIHPLYCFREGDNMQHIYYKKNTDGLSEVFGGYYDPEKIKNEDTSENVQVSENANSTVFGSKYSPTCDAKRTDIID